MNGGPLGARYYQIYPNQIDNENNNNRTNRYNDNYDEMTPHYADLIVKETNQFKTNQSNQHNYTRNEPNGHMESN